MTQGTRPIGEDDLNAYVDGALDDARRALVEQWLRAHPDIRRRVEKDIEIARHLRETLAPLGDVSLPDRFRMENLRARRRQRWAGRLRQVAAAVVLVAISGAGGWILRGQLATGAGAAPETEVVAALAAHRVFVPEKLHPVEVSAKARDHLGTWLGNRLGRPVPIPDLTDEGLTLMGGRLLPGPDGPAGQLMYQTASGKRVTLYLQPTRGKASAFAFARKGDVGTLAWRSGRLDLVLTGPIARDELIRIAHVIRPAAL